VVDSVQFVGEKPLQLGVAPANKELGHAPILSIGPDGGIPGIPDSVHIRDHASSVVRVVVQ
jgi:hypothetical protein